MPAGKYARSYLEKHGLLTGVQSRIANADDVRAALALVEAGAITGPGGAPYGSGGFVVNCPIVFRFL